MRLRRREPRFKRDGHRRRPGARKRHAVRSPAPSRRRKYRSLPLNGRNFLDLALLVPGVSPTNVGSTQLFPETSAVPGVSLSVGSQRNLSNNFIVDGLSANDDAAGLSGITYGVDAVDQFQVVTSGGQAELGRALGGYVNVVTKSGTNPLQATLYDFVRDDRFNARERAVRHDAADGPVAVRRQHRRAGRAEPDVLLRERRATPLDQSGLVTIPPRQRERHQRAAGRGRISGPAGDHRRLSESRAHHELARRSRSPGQRGRSVRRSLQPVRRQLDNARGAGGAERAERLGRARQPRSVARRQQHADAVAAHGESKPARSSPTAILQALPSDPIGPAVSIAGRRVVRHAARAVRRGA